MKFILCASLVFLLISCGSDGSSGSSGRDNNMPPTAQDVTVDVEGLDSVTYDLVSHISDTETAKDKLVIEVVDKPKYSNSAGSGVAEEFTENCPLDSNRTGKIVWNSNTEFFYEVCDGSSYVGSVCFTYRVMDERNNYSGTKTVTMIDFFYS